MAMGYQSKILDHLGLVARMYDELRIGEVIDRSIEQDTSQRIVSVGQVVKAMVLNGLGFVNQRLYLVSSFFQSKPTERLVGKGIRSEHLNDDTLGRALDDLYESGVTPLFGLKSQEATHQLGLKDTRFGHLDITSFHLDGDYNSEDSPEEGIVHITKGYSRDHRPDLNQVGLELIVENRVGLPTLMKPLNGNANDKTEFNHLINSHVDQLQQVEYLVGDSALYTEENIDSMGDRKWISRVPETIKGVKNITQYANSDDMVVMNDNYKYLSLCSNFADIKQRWVLVESEHARNRAIKTVRKRFKKGSQQEVKRFTKLCQQTFACEPDAQQAMSGFIKTLKFITIE